MRYLLLLLASAVSAQAPLDPAYGMPLGRREWVFPCSPWCVSTEITSSVADSIFDPAYGTPNSRSVVAGGTFYVRCSQRDFMCLGWQGGNATWPAIFFFGAKDEHFSTMAHPLIALPQNKRFTAGGWFGSTHYGQHETRAADVWALEITVPNSPNFYGTVWEAQGIMLSPVVGSQPLIHLGSSHYVRVW